MKYQLKTLGDALFAHSLAQDLMVQIAEIADDSWSAGLDEPAVGRVLLTIQTLAMRARELNAVTNEIFDDLVRERQHLPVREVLQGAVLITPACGHQDMPEADHA